MWYSHCFLPWESWQIDRLVTPALVCRCMSVLNQTAMSSASRANTLEGYVVMGSEVVLSHVAAPPCFTSVFFFLVLIRVPYGWWWTCLLPSSHAAWCEKCILTSSYAEYFCHFQSARWLAAFPASTMLLWRRDTCYHSLVTHIYTAELKWFCLYMCILNHVVAGKFAVGLLSLSDRNSLHLSAICNSVAIISWWLWTWSVRMTTARQVSWGFMLC